MLRIAATLVVLAVSMAGPGHARAETLADLAAAARAAMAETAKPAPVAPTPVVHQPVAAMLSLPVPAGTIGVGEIISEAMLQDRSFSPTSADRIPVFTNRASLVGKVARRVLMAGNPIPLNAVGPARVVTRGVAATIYFEEGGLSIRAVGMPLEPGSPGAVIRLKNLDSGQIVTGTVQTDGSVKVGG